MEEGDVSLVRLRSFACDDMHIRAIDHVQSGFRFWGRRRKKNTLFKFIPYGTTDMETSEARS